MSTIGGELRYTVPVGERVSPFVLAGFGGGISRPNVSDRFPDTVTNTVTASYFGGGVRVRVSPSVAVFADARLALMLERDTLGGRLPVRVGVAWSF